MMTKNKKQPQPPSVQEQIRKDKLLERYKRENRELKKRYDYLLKDHERMEEYIGAFEELDKSDFSIEILSSHGKSSSATAVVVASDWHIEETVTKESVLGKNEYNLFIAEESARNFFKNVVRLYEIHRKEIHIDHVVVALLGDYFSNRIHPELKEIVGALPMEAMVLAEGFIESGIQYMLHHIKVPITFVCHSGNHARTTKGYRYSTEWGHSLEWVMFTHLHKRFKAFKRVKFIVPRAKQSYLNIYDYRVRFLHGHGIKGGFGVGGVSIPVNRAVQRWNNTDRADLTVLGHFHQFRDGGSDKWVMNGSMIGYNSFAQDLGYSYDEPKQMFFLIDKNRGKTIVAPILLRS